MSIVSICTGLKDFIIDVNGMRRNYTEKNKRTIHTTKSSIKTKKKKKTMTRLQDDEQALND